MAIIGYRHNVLCVSSIDSFLNIRGGLNKSVRDVYFVRALGEPQNVNDMLVKIDDMMTNDKSKTYVSYQRFGPLPLLAGVEDSNFYGSLYQDMISGKKIELRQWKMNDALYETAAASFKEILSVFRQCRSNVNASIERNFGTKLLFWLDQTAGSVLTDWTERSCVKIIADNIQKEQEYLYYLFLTMLGCDVLLLQTHKDLTLNPKLLSYTHIFSVGDFGNTVIQPFALKVIPASQPVRNTGRAAKSEENAEVKPSISPTIKSTERPVEKTAAKPAEPPKEPSVQNTVSKPAPVEMKSEKNHFVPAEEQIPPLVSPPKKKEPRREKSSEEIAQIASSVVLIAVHNSGGRVTGTGSGIMIGREGFILTNCHVVDGGFFFSVRIENEEKAYISSEIIKYNKATDLAIIRIKRKLQPVPIYNEKEDLVRGQKVIAIGSPLGLFNSVSDGIISGFRQIKDNEMIQFTAPISPGSSGGAVLNTYGELIGISTAGIDSGQNINLAVGYKNIRLFANGFIDL